MTTVLDTTETMSPRDRQVSDFSALTRTVQETGLMRRRYAYYWGRFALLVGLLAGAVAAMVLLGDSWWQLAVAAGLGVLFTQFAFLGHDAAHRQIFKSGQWNDWASLVIANLFGGMSYGWWLHKHSRHHAKPNVVGTDPDMLNGVLTWETETITKPKTGIWAWLAANQGYWFFPLLLLEGLNLHANGIKTILGKGPVKRRGIEITFVGIRLVGFVVAVFLLMPVGIGFAFLGVQLGVFGFLMGASFAPNHKGMPVVGPDVKIDFLRRQVLMSRNITGGRWIDVWMGGLNFQVEHHLFPSMPSPALRQVRPLVMEFCAERGIKYTETSLIESYRIVVEYLNRVGLAARDPFQCPLTAQFRSAR
ncbi:fatty acid desaturase family protein [Sanguibacter suaedae]|uniref:Acyl-CoA desaturase n=1 Tax=Sanguibacter suaedae TaxID=2795737 RepID=A0A934IA10_9MICO|nr:acyl-CoA desaturase [Sanguibacter suaedae]MBI9114652.1 acyl-CoA desaturase [Sanguibacter suaedae]